MNISIKMIIFCVNLQIYTILDRIVYI